VRIFNISKGIKGFWTLYNSGLKLRCMVSEVAKLRAKVVTFFKKYGLEATIEAFSVKKSSIYRWAKLLKDNQGRLEVLNNKPRAPKNRRKTIVDPRIIKFIEDLRKQYPRLSKTKIKPFLDDFCLLNNLKTVSESTIGRIIKKNNFFYQPTKVTHFGKIITIKRKKKLRRNDYQPANPGDLLQLDSIVIFLNGIKRYIITAIDLKSSFSFAYTYSSLSSNIAKDFFSKLEYVAPFKIKHIQTDNGQEFHKHFQDTLDKKGIIHFFNYPKRPQMNAKIERFNRTIQEEFINWHLSYLYDLEKFNELLMNWLLWYNTKRPHLSLNKEPPLKYLINTLGFSKMLWTYTARHRTYRSWLLALL